MPERHDAAQSRLPDATDDGGSDTKIALVTGAARGIGKQVAKRLVQEGLRVYIGVRDLERGRAAALEIGATAIALDTTDDASVEAAVSEFSAREKLLDVLVNNAGIQDALTPPMEQDLDSMLAVYATNVVGCVRVTNAFLSLLEKSGDPRIINVSSGTGSVRMVTDRNRYESKIAAISYPASKAALNMVTAQYAKALPRVFVAAADPGSTQTDMNAGKGQHTVEEGSEVAVRLALLRPSLPSGGFFDVTGQVAW